MVEEIKSELNKINWDSPEVTANELILKTMVEQLLILVVEETNQIAEFRRLLVNMKKSKKPNLSPRSDEVASFEPDGIDYQKILREIAQRVNEIQQIAKQMRQERESAKVQNQAMTKQLMSEIEFLRGELERKRMEPDSPYKTPIRSALKTTTNTKNVIISTQDDDSDNSFLSTPTSRATRKGPKFIFGNDASSSSMMQTPEKGTEGQSTKARKEMRSNFKRNVFN